jgi:hypothetical protein
MKIKVYQHRRGGLELLTVLGSGVKFLENTYKNNNVKRHYYLHSHIITDTFYDTVGKHYLQSLAKNDSLSAKLCTSRDPALVS